MRCFNAAIFFSITLIPALASSQVSYEYAEDEFTGEDNSSVQIVGPTAEFTLAWKCLADGLNVILAHEPLGGDSDNEVIVRTKIDDNEPSDPNYYLLYSGGAITIFDMDDAASFTADAIAADKVMIRIIDPLDNEKLTDAFSTNGLENALSKLLCYP
jgi:hypothetical protein